MDTFFLFLPLYITYLFLTDFKTPVNIWGSLTLSLAGLGRNLSSGQSISHKIFGKTRQS